MARIRFAGIATGLAVAGVLGIHAAGPAAAQNLPKLDHLKYITQDAKASKAKALKRPIEYAWDVFFLANWPALPGAKGRGKPDPSKKIGDTGGPMLWQSWKGDDETYPPNGVIPGPWATPYPVPPGGAAKLPPADTGDLWTPLTGNVQADGFDLKGPDGQPIRYHIRLNRPAFEYVRRNKLYSIDGQISFAKANGALDFRWDAIEAKAAWRELDPVKDKDEIPKYFTSHAFYPQRDDDGNITGWKKVLVGLTGLHFATKAIDNWVWITFEQVDNEEWTGVHRVNPIPDKVKQYNAKVQRLLAGTPWENYELVGVQTDFGTEDDPTILANTQIESHFQSRSSCMSCHGMANVKQSEPTPENPVRASYVDPNHGSPPYYVGPIPDLPEGYSHTDFVFSLYRAQYEKN
ncbi:hypothetical protein [Ferruginivarius sediminum]|uniref:Cytochrome c domain-containing protein n=1 Tax=Ferruginivarius sediminum TaxID=2661937 RepID=A0A369TCZ0_9PROT|nr:hypothetical protein [Ferruginivarius sediminum]RDD62682.1 hypothetical protein DRB17_05840 [Ferruginivarius sediminum]